MSKASRLARPSSAGTASKLPSPHKEVPAGARARVVSVGEKLMRAGSDVTPAKQRVLAAVGPTEQQQAIKQPTQNQNNKSQSLSPAADGPTEQQQAVKQPAQTQNNKSQSLSQDIVAQTRRRISPPKASALPQGTIQRITTSKHTEFLSFFLRKVSIGRCHGYCE
ncbi:hypothetical protein DPEC_G00072560 [Dallia pectoralis]|uniref:Uncharacterized protein n=1 Tax=Dallia pectoralis TaxID=75939 RepID=A0ACC2H2U5_DALPE|nr:hypothetical protein DPEC_G00072560 [Dallia pectoralis]